MIGLIGAMEIEMECLLREVESPCRQLYSGVEYVQGTLRGHRVVLARGGIGKVNAAMCAQTMALVYRPSLILNTGVAGSLSPDLGVGDICVGTEVVQHDVDTTALGDAPGMVSGVNRVYFPCDGQAVGDICLAVRSLEGVRVRQGRVASGEQFVASQARKDEIVRLFHASCCEMEAGAIAQVCFINRIPFAVIRAISDGGDESAAMSYAQFLPLAARNSAALLTAFLDQRAEK